MTEANILKYFHFRKCFPSLVFEVNKNEESVKHIHHSGVDKLQNWLHILTENVANWRSIRDKGLLAAVRKQMRSAEVAFKIVGNNCILKEKK